MRRDTLRRGAFIASLASFAVAFQPQRNQLLVDGLWILAMGLWVSEIRSRSPSPLQRSQPPARAWLLIGLVLAVFAATWLPFYDNWRWAFTSDSLAWYAVARSAAHAGLAHNLLSVHGVDDNFTYLHSLASNSLMLLIQPTLLWHRVGKLIVSGLSLATLYAYFTLVLGQWWAAAIVIVTATNYVWLWFSYVSYGHIDTHLFYFLTLLLGTLAWSHPDRLAYWMWCGLTGGLALFFTQTSWSVVAAVGFVLIVFAWRTQRPKQAAVYVASFLLAATPILLQFPDFLRMNLRQTRSAYDWTYLASIFGTILRLPYDWDYCRIGVQGAVLRPPLGMLYLAGLALAGLAVFRRSRQALRAPRVAPLLLGLLLWDAALMTLTNNANPQPSTKRVFSLIPLQGFMALLPLYVLYVWSQARQWTRWAAIGATAGVMGMYAVENAQLLTRPRPRVYGVNVFDGMIELRQRFPGRHVRLLSSREGMRDWMLGAESLPNELYHLHDTVRVSPVLTPAELRLACNARELVCYEPAFDAGAFGDMVRVVRPCLQQVPLLNAIEVHCFDCDPTACVVPPTDAELAALPFALPSTAYDSRCR